MQRTQRRAEIPELFGHKRRKNAQKRSGQLDPFYRRQRREWSGETSKSRNTESGNRKTAAANASEWLKAECGETGKAEGGKTESSLSLVIFVTFCEDFVSVPGDLKFGVSHQWPGVKTISLRPQQRTEIVE
jgi:hypothetical protein